MSTPTTAARTNPAVDVASRSVARPGLALVLALLSLPGVTLAWDLPKGGYWIGVPLAIAAIVVGLRARRAGSTSRVATAAIWIGAFAVAFVAICSIALSM